MAVDSMWVSPRWLRTHILAMERLLETLTIEVASIKSGTEEGMKMVNDNLDLLRQGETDLKTAIADAAAKVSQELADLAAKINAGVNHDELAGDVAAIQADIASVQQIGAQPAPAPEPTPAPAPEPAPAPAPEPTPTPPVDGGQ